MKLGIRMLDSSSSLNNLMYMNQVVIDPGETVTIYFQLVDLDKSQGQCPQRYMPASGATMSVKLTSLDSSKNITKVPTNPFPDDRSIWSFNLSAAETQYAAGVNLSVTLTEGANVKKAEGQGVVIFGPKSQHSC